MSSPDFLRSGACSFSVLCVLLTCDCGLQTKATFFTMKVCEVRDYLITLGLWDTPGEDYGNTDYYRNASAIIICYGIPLPPPSLPPLSSSSFFLLACITHAKAAARH